MGVVVIRQDGKTKAWKEALQAHSPQIPIYSFEETHPKEKITMAIVWKHPPKSLLKYPNLQLIASFGAGVDFIFEDPGLPEGIPVTRVVDPLLASDMSEFVIAQIFSYLKNLKQYALDQEKQLWKPRPYRRITDMVVGIMGVGALGSVLAEDLLRLGTRVRGWVSTGRKEAVFPIFSGNSQLSEFLGECSVLVCLLPLTDDTRGIIDQNLLQELPKNAFVINAARGGHLVDDDLLKMLDSGHIAGAALDVFHKEPLPKEHPFWRYPSIHLSPHIASVSDLDSVVPQLIENYLRLQNGTPLENLVSRDKGY